MNGAPDSRITLILCIFNMDLRSEINQSMIFMILQITAILKSLFCEYLLDSQKIK
jgi:hypothetical protein